MKSRHDINNEFSEALHNLLTRLNKAAQEQATKSDTLVNLADAVQKLVQAGTLLPQTDLKNTI